MLLCNLGALIKMEKKVPELFDLLIANKGKNLKVLKEKENYQGFLISQDYYSEGNGWLWSKLFEKKGELLDELGFGNWGLDVLNILCKIEEGSKEYHLLFDNEAQVLRRILGNIRGVKDVLESICEQRWYPPKWAFLTANDNEVLELVLEREWGAGDILDALNRVNILSWFWVELTKENGKLFKEGVLGLFGGNHPAKVLDGLREVKVGSILWVELMRDDMALLKQVGDDGAFGLEVLNEIQMRNPRLRQKLFGKNSWLLKDMLGKSENGSSYNLLRKIKEIDVNSPEGKALFEKDAKLLREMVRIGWYGDLSKAVDKVMELSKSKEKGDELLSVRFIDRNRE